MLTQMTWLFHKIIVLQIIKAPSHNLMRPSLDAFRPFALISRAPSLHHQKPKPHICNNMKNVVSFYYQFLHTHHVHSACYHFGMRIPFVSKMQCTTQRVYSKQNTRYRWDPHIKVIGCTMHVMCAKKLIIE